MLTSTLVFATKYEFDKLGRLIKVEYGSEQTTKSVSYSHDKGGNVKKVDGLAAENTTEISTEDSSETTTEQPIENTTSEYILNYSKGENTDNFFSVSANSWNSAVPVTYGDLTLTKAIKMESNTSIRFTAPKEGVLTLVTYSTSQNPAVTVNDESYAVSSNGLTEIKYHRQENM